MINSIRDHHFFDKILNTDSIVIDLGAYLGEFSREISNK